MEHNPTPGRAATAKGQACWRDEHAATPSDRR